jgi:2-methylcitrate dehydratase PrpD
MNPRTAVVEYDAIVRGLADWAPRLDWTTLPESARAVMRSELLDIVGAMVAGRALLGLPDWLAVMIQPAGGTGRGSCDAIGSPGLTPQAAALLNGYYSHALEMDDTHDAAVLHAGATVIPAVLAADDLHPGATGQELMEAITVGIETVCRLGAATRLSLVEGGWLYTPLLGHFGAAAGVARLLGGRGCGDLLARSLGVVYAYTSGNHQPTREGSETKHLQPGIAASNAVSAVLMARAGLQGVKQPFLGEDGLSRVYLRGRLEAEAVLDGLGQRHEVARLSFKPYPSCRLTHPPITAALALRASLGDRLAGLQRVRLLLGSQAHDVVGRDEPEKRRPATRLNAQFSARWCVAVALHHGAVTPLHLRSEVPPGPAVAALIDRIDCAVDPHGTSATGAREIGGCQLEASGSFGEVVRAEVHAKGHPDHPLSLAEMRHKFDGNVACAGVDAEAARRLGDLLLNVENAAVAPRLVATANAAMRSAGC